MKKLIILALGVVFISGCLIRTYTIYKPRQDTQVSGNRGYITGKPPAGKPNSRLGKTRPITVMEVELGSYKPVSSVKRSKSVYPIENVAKKLKKSSNSGLSSINREIPPSKIISNKIEKNSSTKYKDYTVKKNDTLQKISYKFYGTTKKWKLIYNKNKDSIKNPDNVYPGTKLKIPLL